MSKKPELAETKAGEWLLPRSNTRNCQMCGGYGYWGARDETCPSCRGSGHVDEAPAERPFDPVEADCEIQEDVDDDTDDIF